MFIVIYCFVDLFSLVIAAGSYTNMAAKDANVFDAMFILVERLRKTPAN